MKSRMYTAALLALSSIPAVGIAGAAGQTEAAKPAAAGLIGYWPLHGDCRDHSGNELHGVNHGVRLGDAAFDGRGAYIEIPASPKLQLGAGDFTLAAWVHTQRDIDDVIGDEVPRSYPVLRWGRFPGCTAGRLGPSIVCRGRSTGRRRGQTGPRGLAHAVCDVDARPSTDFGLFVPDQQGNVQGASSDPPETSLNGRDLGRHGLPDKPMTFPRCCQLDAGRNRQAASAQLKLIGRRSRGLPRRYAIELLSRRTRERFVHEQLAKRGGVGRHDQRRREQEGSKSRRI